MLGLTQAELAERIGGSEVNVRKLEKGVSAPALVTFMLLAEALGDDPRDMLGSVMARMALLRSNEEEER